MMCGLFGVTTPRHYPAAVPVAAAIDLLGHCAEERGRDAAGVAIRSRTGSWATSKVVGDYAHLRRTHHGLDGALDKATTVLGHTRWATQGGLGRAQASPIRIGALLGTHNGDLDPTTLPGYPGPIFDPRATDSHHLFRAIASVHRRGVHRTSSRTNSLTDSLTEELTAILTTMRGRAALVWTDTGRTDHQIWLARAGLSPLAVGIDVHGALWWASNPVWLRRMADHLALELTITLLPEGTLWTALPQPHHVTCALVAEFKPTVRRRDLAIARTAVWRGFTLDDERADQTLRRHRTIA